MAESSCRGADVDAVEQHGRRSEVAEVVETDPFDRQLVGETRERERGVIGSPRCHPIRLVAEDVANSLVPPVVAGGELAELSEGDRVERETTFCLVLGRSTNWSGRSVGDLAGDVQRVSLEVDVLPLERTEFTASRTGDCGETEEDRQAGVDCACRFDEVDDLLGAGEVKAWPACGWWARSAGRVVADPVPCNALFERAVQHRVNTLYRVGRQRPTASARWIYRRAGGDGCM